MLKQIFIFGAITSLLGAAQAGEIQDASLGARGIPAGLDLDVELKMEMEREFADILPRATSTNFQVRSFPFLFLSLPLHLIPKLTSPQDIRR